MRIFNLRSGKGFIYSLDAIVAIILVITVIAAFSLSFESKLNPGGLVLRKIGNDLVNVMNEKKYFHDLDTVIISGKVKEILPKNYGFSFNIITKDGSVNGGEGYGFEDYYSGFGVVKVRGGLGIIKYKIWIKEWW